jgi:hypothetical protein
MLNLCKIILSLSVLYAPSFADQYEWITLADAKKAETILKEQGQMLNYCEPCEDTISSIIKVNQIVVLPIQDGYYTIKVNGNAIDLAYIFINKNGTFKNLATYMGLEISEDSPKTLEKSLLSKDYIKALKLYTKSCNVGKKECEKYEQSLYKIPNLQKQLKATIEAKKFAEEQEQVKQQEQEQLEKQAYQQKQIDLQNEQARLRDQLLKSNNYEKAYQLGLIDKDTARIEMLKRGKIIEAYEAKLIDKDTADLYLKKQAMDNATRSSQQQVKAAQDQSDAIRRAGIDAEFTNSPNMLNQQLQNIQNYNQMNQMINQQNINSNMRRYY